MKNHASTSDRVNTESTGEEWVKVEDERMGKEYWVRADAPAVAGVKDKSLIWDDCPACAFKHLSAAYAALTAADLVRPEVPASEIYAARAVIAIRESQTGYTGNLALAAGCLAMAECLNGGEAEAYRLARLDLTTGARDTELYFSMPRPAAFAAAHFTEALRELPALADRMQVAKYLGAHGFRCGTVSEMLDVLRTQILWLTEAYELEAK
jgi:hypothetical protein